MLIEIFAAIRWFFTITTLLGLVSEIFLRRGLNKCQLKFMNIVLKKEFVMIFCLKCKKVNFKFKLQLQSM